MQFIPIFRQLHHLPVTYLNHMKPSTFPLPALIIKKFYPSSVSINWTKSLLLWALSFANEKGVKKNTGASQVRCCSFFDLV